jgi:hypothetical protein
MVNDRPGADRGVASRPAEGAQDEPVAPRLELRDVTGRHSAAGYLNLLRDGDGAPLAAGR